MSMRLMPKSKVAAAQANAKKLEIDEGLKLARRVDGLRETAAQEETNLEKFRSEKVGKIHHEITGLSAERDVLKVEVDRLREERKELMIPLDKEWKELAKAKQQIVHDTANAQSIKAQATEEERAAREAVRLNADALARALTKEERAKDRLEEADRKHEIASECLRSAQEVEAASVRLAEEVEEDLKTRDNAVALRESSATLREANLDERDAELAKGWKLLEDRKMAFERRITRANK